MLVLDDANIGTRPEDADDTLAPALAPAATPTTTTTPDVTGAPDAIATPADRTPPTGSLALDTPDTPDTPATPPVAGLGVDIIEIERMERVLARTPRMRERVFSQGERAYAQAKARPVVHYALFFAAKEAVLKALGTGFAGMAFTDVEVDHDRYGRPVPVLRGRAQEIAQAQGVVEMQLSLSYTHAVGVASAVAIKEQDRPRKDEKVDPRAELARQFKEMRAMLDDMDERIQALDDEDDEGSAGSGASKGFKDKGGAVDCKGNRDSEDAEGSAASSAKKEEHSHEHDDNR
ncbi:MAG: holo-ACP synthase [Coriobacteriales bacterium]|jgi:holo-[acyl-carrier protein] synthase|nr:holo-ACP synthase [Coriobacteriales bacterium]